MSKKNPKEAEIRLFAKAWNDVRSYPARYDLERHFGKKFSALQAKVRRYAKFSAEHPELNLPELLWRESSAGGMIAVPAGVIHQLDEFRFDTDLLKHAKGVVITSAQFGAPLNTWFWNSLKVYAQSRGFPLVVMPIKYGPVKTVYQAFLQRRILTSTFPDELKGHMIFDNTPLCKGKLMLNTMRMRPTLTKFLTKAVTIRGGQVSQIYAAPKLELDHLPRVGHHSAKAIMTTGAVTHPNYHVDNIGQQDRTGEIATQEHNYAAVVVEFMGDAFHFRQLHADKKGQFYDINAKEGGANFYTPQGVEHSPDDVDALVCGDWHTGKTDPKVRKGTFGHKRSIVQVLNPNHVVLHDFVDCDSVSKWEQHQATRRGFKAPLGWDSLEGELNAAVAELNWMRKRTKAQLHVVPSNHNEYVTEYIEDMRWVGDDANLAIGAKLYSVMVDDLKARNPRKVEAKAIDPVVWWFRTYAPFAQSHERQDALLLPLGAKNPILCSMHGDKGPRGGQTRSTDEFLSMNQRIVLGHNHVGTIIGQVWRVGTSTYRMQFYVDAPATNWTQTHCVIFSNGQRQLLNFVKGTWHG